MPQLVSHADIAQAAAPGASSLTLRASLDYIRKWLPRCWLLENAFSRRMVKRLQRQLKSECPWYDVAILLTAGTGLLPAALAYIRFVLWV